MILNVASNLDRRVMISGFQQHLMAQLYGAYPDSQDTQDTSES